MTLSLDEYKRNPSTGKLEKTGNTQTVGKVSNPGGGYTSGVVSTQNASGQTISSLSPAVQPPQAPNTSTPYGAVYTPPPNFYMENNPNTSTPNGAVYTPPPNGSRTTGTTPGAAGSPPQQQTPQGNQSTPTTPYRTATVIDKNGVATTYNIDPTKSFISQTGQYENPFWTSEGQKERLANALETASFRTTSTAVMGQDAGIAGDAITGAIDALNLAALVDAGAGLWSKIAQADKIGTLALSKEGVKILAGSQPEAAGTAANIAKVGKAARTTKNIETEVSFFSNLMGTTMKKATLGKWLVVTGIVGAAGNIAGAPITAASTNKYQNEYIADSEEMISKLIATGNPEMIKFAGELNDDNVDLKNGLDNWIGYLTPVGMSIEKSKVDDFRLRLGQINIKYQELVAQQAIEKADAAAATKREQDLQDAATKREQQLQDAATKREQELADRADQRAYNEQLQSLDYQQQLQLDATATETSQGSTLTFGLLGTSGATEFVDKDKAANYYFGKVYDELTPAQKLLLNLLKGKGG